MDGSARGTGEFGALRRVETEQSRAPDLDLEGSVDRVDVAVFDTERESFEHPIEPRQFDDADFLRSLHRDCLDSCLDLLPRGGSVRQSELLGDVIVRVTAASKLERLSRDVSELRFADIPPCTVSHGRVMAFACSQWPWKSSPIA